MIIAHKIELAPTQTQTDYFRRACGTARFVWNWALTEWQRKRSLGQPVTALSLKKQFNATKYSCFPWLKDIHRDAHSQPFAHLGRAWARYFRQLSAGTNARAPSFKKRGACKDSFYVANDQMAMQENRVRLPLVGWISLKEAPRFGGRIMGASVQRHAERWFIAVQVELAVSWLCSPNREEAVGIDLNVHEIVCSSGKVYETPQPMKRILRRLCIRQRSVNRKITAAKKNIPPVISSSESQGDPNHLLLSKNRAKASSKVARAHYRLRCIRQDFLHKTTSIIARENQAVVIEDLQVRNMTSSATGTLKKPGAHVKQKSGLNRVILDVGFAEFRRQLTYKCERFGTELIVADRWFPSSKLCSGCGNKNESLKLKDRHWCCKHCGSVQNRDLNAAVNLERLATGKTHLALPEAIGKITSVRDETGH